MSSFSVSSSFSIFDSLSLWSGNRFAGAQDRRNKFRIIRKKRNEFEALRNFGTVLFFIRKEME